jgi:hypothetical protein
MEGHVQRLLIVCLLQAHAWRLQLVDVWIVWHTPISSAFCWLHTQYQLASGMPSVVLRPAAAMHYWFSPVGCCCWYCRWYCRFKYATAATIKSIHHMLLPLLVLLLLLLLPLPCVGCWPGEHLPGGHRRGLHPQVQQGIRQRLPGHLQWTRHASVRSEMEQHAPGAVPVVQR